MIRHRDLARRSSGAVLPALATLVGSRCLLARHLAAPAPAWKQALSPRSRRAPDATPAPLPPERDWAAWRRKRRIPAGARHRALPPRQGGACSRLLDRQRRPAARAIYVLTPLELEDGAIVIVNRGFVPAELRDPATPAAAPDRPARYLHRADALRRRTAAGSCPTTTRHEERLVHARPDGIARAPGLARVAPFLIDAGGRAPTPAAGRGAGDPARLPEQPPAICADLVRARADAWSAFSPPSPGSRARPGKPERACRPRAPRMHVTGACRLAEALPPAHKDPSRAACLHPGRSARARLRRRAACRPCPRRRPLRAAEPGPRCARHDRGSSPASPIADVAEAVIGAASSTARSPRPRLLAHDRASLCLVPPPGRRPLVQIGDNLFVLELFHGPTLAFKDVAMQLLGAPDGPRAARRAARAPPSSARPRAIPAAPPSRPSAGSTRSTSSSSIPHGRVTRRAAPADDHRRRRRTSMRIAVEGTFDDCQALVKAMFNHHAFRDELQLSGVNSINWARIAAQIGLLLHGRGGARRAAPAGVVRRCRPAISATCSPAASRSAWACRSSG